MIKVRVVRLEDKVMITSGAGDEHRFLIPVVVLACGRSGLSQRAANR